MTCGMAWKLTDAGVKALEGRLSAPQRRVLHVGLTAILRNRWAEDDGR